MVGPVARRLATRPSHRRQALVSAFPDHAQVLLLKTALCSDDEAKAAWFLWKNSYSLEEASTPELRLLTMVHRRVRQLDPGYVGMPMLAAASVALRFDTQLAFETAELVAQGLQDLGIDFVFLKGLPLALTVYGGTGMRPMSDVDILVRPPDVPRTVAWLEAQGFVSQSEDIRADRIHSRCQGWSYRHAACFESAVHCEVDLHWRLLLDVVPTELEEAIWASAQTFSWLGHRMKAPPPEVLLLHCLYHGLQAEPIASIRWIADAVLITRMRRELDWSRLLALAHACRRIEPVRVGLGYIATQFGAPVPPEILSRLRPTAASAADRWEFALQNRQRGALGELLLQILRFLRFRSLERSHFPWVAGPAFVLYWARVENWRQAPRRLFEIVLRDAFIRLERLLKLVGYGRNRRGQGGVTSKQLQWTTAGDPGRRAMGSVCTHSSVG